MRLNSFFAQYPVFHYEELRSYLRQGGAYKPTTLKALVQYHIEKGHIARIHRGYYAVISSRHSDVSLTDSLLIAGRATKDAIVAYHSALSFHAIDYSIFSTEYFCAIKPMKTFEFNQTVFHRVSHPKTLQPNHLFVETKLYDRQGLDIRVTTLERTLVDCLDKPQFSGGWEEIYRAVAMINFLDIEKIIDYVLQLNNATTIAKTGFFLEQCANALGVQETQLQRLEQSRPKGVCHVERKTKYQCQYFKRWNLIVPLFIVNQTWEEPHDDFV